MTNNFGNRITDNAFKADDGLAVIASALAYVEKNLGWRPLNERVLFNGVYYDSKRVGSHIMRVENSQKETAVLKIQLHPLPFDEGFIIRHINKHNKSKKIKTVDVLNDLAWNKELGFGYVLFRDVSNLKNLWEEIDFNKDRALHKKFLVEFINNVLPIESWMDKPEDGLGVLYRKAFVHFQEIAEKSTYQHIGKAAVEKRKKIYFEIIERMKFGPAHFTHGHLSGKDIKYDEKTGVFYLMANLYWSYRPQYYELTFPMWVDIMDIRDVSLKLENVLNRVDSWSKEWKEGVFDNDPTETLQYWFNLLERSMLTIMLDLGAGEWKREEVKEKKALLDVWVELFDWIVKNKFNY